MLRCSRIAVIRSQATNATTGIQNPMMPFQAKGPVCGEFQICRMDPADIQVLSRLFRSLRCLHARCEHFACPSHRHGGQTPPAGRRSMRCRRVASAQTSALDSESVAGESTESSADRPSHYRTLLKLDAPYPPAAYRHRVQAVEHHGVPPRLGEAQVPIALHAKRAPQARPQRPRCGADCRHR